MINCSNKVLVFSILECVRKWASLCGGEKMVKMIGFVFEWIKKKCEKKIGLWCVYVFERESKRETHRSRKELKRIEIDTAYKKNQHQDF